MYERRYGDKYQDGLRDAAQIAKLIRKDIKDAIAAGTLPGTFRDNYRVRTQKYSMGQAIDIRVIGLPHLFQNCDGTVPGSKSFHVQSFDRPVDHNITVNAEDWRDAIEVARHWYKAPASERFAVAKGWSAQACRNPWCANGERADSPHAEHHRVLTVAGQAVLKELERIHWAYNYDGSEVMTDYFDKLYGGTVDIYEWENKAAEEVLA